MRRRLLLYLTLFLAGATALNAQDWAGRGRLQGIVTDAANTPIKDAKVTVYLGEEGRGPEPVRTDKKGRWSVLGLATGGWTFVIEAPGYKAAEGVTTVVSEGLGPGQTLRITLNPIPKEMQEPKGPDPRAMIEQGNALLVEKKYAEARAKYQEAVGLITVVESHVPVLRAIANTYYAEGKPDEAIATLKKALEIVPDDQETLKLLATLLVNEGKEEEAKAYMAQIVGGFKLDPNTLLNQGIEAYNANRLDEAAAKFEQVVAENPALPDAYYYRGLIYLNQQKNAEAKADFEKLLELAPDYPKASEVKEFLKYLDSSG
jgi:tetratricopeptide (TPR) repeat protein